MAGETVFQAEVLIFYLLDDHIAPRCYAWEKTAKVWVPLVAWSALQAKGHRHTQAQR
jgi:hypothetical protein